MKGRWHLRPVRSLPIRAKLIAIMLATTGAALVPLAGAVVWIEARDAPRALRHQLEALAAVIADRSTAALTFDDRATAAENLASLSAQRDILYAEIRDALGKRFAEYRPAALAVGADAAPRLAVVREVVLEGQAIGEVRIESAVAQVRAGLLRYTALLAAMLAGSFALALGVSARLQRLISSPIFALREAALRVSARGDYSVRVPRASDDELGALVDGFNHMLEQVEERDRALARWTADLEAEVARRSRALEDANRKRIEWLENMARFLRHELKNAGIGIKTSLDLMERRARAERLDTYLERARRSLDYMDTLLKSVGDASTLEAGIFREAHGPLPLSELIGARLADYPDIYPGQSFAVSVEDALIVQGDGGRLIQMLDNLVSNAVDHCAPGTQIRVELARRGRDALLTVEDQGDHLPEDRERIFDLFVSLRPRRAHGDDNLGLGLYLVRLIAESNGGRVWAEDPDAGAGARFRVLLPLYESAGEARQVTPASGSTQR